MSIHVGGILCSNCRDLPLDAWEEEQMDRIEQEQRITPDDPYAEDRAGDLQEASDGMHVEIEISCENCGCSFHLPEHTHKKLLLADVRVLCPACLLDGGP